MATNNSFPLLAIVVGYSLWQSPPAFSENTYIFEQAALTPRGQRLEEVDLKMPGLGYTAGKEQLRKRLAYAETNEWLTEEQAGELAGLMADLEYAEKLGVERDGKLSTNSLVRLSAQLSSINSIFEADIHSQEMSQPNGQGLLAKNAVIDQTIYDAMRAGHLTIKKGKELRKAGKQLAAKIEAGGQNKDATTLAKLDEELKKFDKTVTSELKAGQLASKVSRPDFRLVTPRNPI